jgi:septum formation protein
MGDRLILASKSPRRAELLKQLGIDFDIAPSRVEEDVAPHENPREHVSRLAEAKARDVADRFPDRWVLGADTIVLIDDRILGKPENEADALDMLRQLSGQTHTVLTGISVHHRRKGVTDQEVVQTTVKVRPLLEDEMTWYLSTGEPMDKAGAYAIQGLGTFMIESIHGSYTNVVGLPLCELIRTLRRLGAITFSNSGFQIGDEPNALRQR